MLVAEYALDLVGVADVWGPPSR